MLNGSELQLMLQGLWGLAAGFCSVSSARCQPAVMLPDRDGDAEEMLADFWACVSRRRGGMIHDFGKGDDGLNRRNSC